MVDIASNIIQTIRLLLKKQTPENIKCVCQTLKVCKFGDNSSNLCELKQHFFF